MTVAATMRRRLPRRRTEAGLLVVGATVVVFATILESIALTGALPDHAVQFLIALLVIGIAVQAVNRYFVPDADPVIVPVALVLNGIGYVMIERGDPTQAGQQVAWTALGLLLYTAVLYTVRRSRDLERYRYLMLVAAFLLLISPLVPGIGLKINGARLWVHVSSLEFQPVEIAKLLLVIFFASYFVDKRELLTVPTKRVGDRLLPDLRAFGPMAIAGVMALLIILAEDDIGFSLILFLVFLTMIWVTTGRWTYVVVGLGAFVLAAFVASHALVQVNTRISDWINPWADPTGRGFQPVQGELAFGRGGLFGTGIGFGLASNNNVLPVGSSDFIFAIIGEELGLVGALGVVFAFSVIVGAGLRAARRARSEFARLCATGLTATLGLQAFLIMAGDTRLLPLTGVTLPFVAYGGSSLIANYALLALLMRISNEGNQLPEATPPSRSRIEEATTIGVGGR
ncbi:MAG TPA: FtsW/RodA/SpoVE family cell cycle protein [Acidimicrobiales bacterium]|nr:FtsW/RodA/SpoVE family cell cycle protein [Acidimicrobiales bacterium]